MEKEQERDELIGRISAHVTLLVFTVYYIGFILVAVNSHMPIWFCYLLPILLVLTWIIQLMKPWDFKTRAHLVTGIFHLGMILYAMQIDDLRKVFSTLIGCSVAVSLFGIPKLVSRTNISLTFLIIYHFLTQNDFALYDAEELTHMVVQVLSVYFVTAVVRLFIYNQNDNRRRLLETIGELDVAQQSKDDFLTNISHEIRTPINTIYGLSEVILRENPSDQFKEDVVQIQKAGRNLMSIVGDVLDFSELQSDKMEIIHEVYNIHSSVEEIIDMCYAKKGEKEIELVVDISAKISSGLVGDEQKIRRVIMHVLDNAIKFTDKGCVSLLIDYRDTIYGMNLLITIRDTGIGIKPEKLERIFDSFNQVDTKRNRENGGIGLGLAITKATVEKMGGTIMVDSAYGKGTEVRIVIPQKVAFSNPIASVENPRKKLVAIYIDMERFEMMAIRDAYITNVRHMVQQLGVRIRMCRNLAELKRRLHKEEFTHVFIATNEYLEDKPFFDELSKRMSLTIIMDTWEKAPLGEQIIRLDKPFYVIPIAKILNNQVTAGQVTEEHRFEPFTAPDAHVLVVDDNVMNLHVVQGLLKPYKIQVTTATSGKEALQLIETRDYDFVFMDHMMPEMDGVEVLQHIREKQGSYFQKVPVIALTANALGGMQEVFLSHGFADFVAKPLEVSVLDRVLRRNIPIEKQIAKTIETADKGKSVPTVTTVEKSSEESKASKDNQSAEFGLIIGDLDIATAVSFCGDEENLLDILRVLIADSDSTKEKIVTAFQNEDWKNYTIHVHGLKSSMKSVGAITLSDMAKNLEFAGKENRISYITQNHDSMLQEYDRVLQMLKEHPLFAEEFSEEQMRQSQNTDAEGDTATDETAVQLDVLEETEFRELLTNFEDAAYLLDQEVLLELLESINHRMYKRMDMTRLYEQLRRKIKNEDYLSAYDALVSWKKEIDKR